MGLSPLSKSRLNSETALGRQDLMPVLSKLTPEAWTRTAIVKNWSRGGFSRVQSVAWHEVEHCQQLEALVR